MLPEEEEGLLPSSGSQTTARRGPSRLIAVATAAGLLALVGLFAFVGSPPAHSNGRVAVAPPAVTVLAEQKKDKEQLSEAVARLSWDKGDIGDAMSLKKGQRYWVKERHSSGWTYAYDYNYTAQGWVPDALLYHGSPAIVRKAYKNKELAVAPGDSVWVLDKQTSKHGPNWIYVLAGSSYGWINENAIKGDDHPNPCFVKKDFKVLDAGQLDMKQGEIVWAAKVTDPTATWVSVENAVKDSGYVPRDHLIEKAEQPVLQTFGATEEAALKETPPKPVLHVQEGVEVWVDEKHSPAKPHWLYAYMGHKEGYVPKWALLDVKVDGENTAVGEGEGKQPHDSAQDASHEAEEDAAEEGFNTGPEGLPPTETTKEPAATTKEPAATTKEPAATTKEPAATTNEPAATTKEPAATTKEAATTEKPATTKEPSTTEEPSADKEESGAKKPDADQEEPKSNTTTPKSEEMEEEKEEEDAKDDSAKKKE